MTSADGAAAVKTTAAVKATACEGTAGGVGTGTGAYPAAGRICVRDAAVIEAAEGAGMISAG
jgi:hypothetical protein